MDPRVRPQPVLDQLVQVAGQAQAEAGGEPQAVDRPGMKDRLYKVYQKMPEPIRRVAHRIVRGK